MHWSAKSILILGLAACAESKFKATEKPSAEVFESPAVVNKALPQEIFISSNQNGNIPNPFSLNAGDVSIRLENLYQFSTEESQIKKPLAVYFALDRSTSMDLLIGAVKTSAKEFATTLNAQGFDARFGAVAFRDNVDQTLHLTNYADFQLYIDKLNTLEVSPDINVDFPEGALVGLLQAHRNILLEETRAGAERIVVLITDAPGHLGGPVAPDARARNCDPLEVSKVYKLPEAGSVKLFYSASSAAVTDTRQKCQAFASAKVQYDAILNDLKTAAVNPGTFVGQALSYPFSASTLVSELTPIIVKTLAKENLVCRVQAVNLSYAGRVVADLATTEFEVAADGNLVIKNAIPLAKLKELNGKQLDMAVTRCCPNQENTCAYKKEQNVSFILNLE